MMKRMLGFFSAQVWWKSAANQYMRIRKGAFTFLRFCFFGGELFEGFKVTGYHFAWILEKVGGCEGVVEKLIGYEGGGVGVGLAEVGEAA